MAARSKAVSATPGHESQRRKVLWKSTIDSVKLFNNADSVIHNRFWNPFGMSFGRKIDPPRIEAKGYRSNHRNCLSFQHYWLELPATDGLDSRKNQKWIPPQRVDLEYLTLFIDDHLEQNSTHNSPTSGFFGIFRLFSFE